MDKIIFILKDNSIKCMSQEDESNVNLTAACDPKPINKWEVSKMPFEKHQYRGDVGYWGGNKS